MIWIGLLVGFVVGMIAHAIGQTWFVKKLTGMTLDEMSDCGCLLIEASQNRESTIYATTCSDGGITPLGSVVLEER